MCRRKPKQAVWQSRAAKLPPETGTRPGAQQPAVADIDATQPLAQNGRSCPSPAAGRNVCLLEQAVNLGSQWGFHLTAKSFTQVAGGKPMHRQIGRNDRQTPPIPIDHGDEARMVFAGQTE